MGDKQRAWGCLIDCKEEIYALGDELFACPELGFRETETARVITRTLDKRGIPYTAGLALTGVRATLGTGGYHIAIVADMDAVLVGGESPRPFHSCGHSIQVAVGLGVMAALRRSGVLDSLGGRVSFLATPAEEYIDLEYRAELIRQGKLRYASGKQQMIRDGVFDDVDCALSCHVSGDPRYPFDLNSTLAGFSVKKVTFKGRASHSGAAPHLGRNALHAATLSLQALALLGQQFAPEAGVQIHPILTQGGASMNVIPELAVLETYVRANTKEALLEAMERFDACVSHCAAALGIHCDIENAVGYLPLRQSEELNAVVGGNMAALCPREEILSGVVSGASGDMGDLGSLLPAVQFGFSGITGRIHSDDFAIENREHVYLHTAQVMLGTVLDLLADPERQVRNESFLEDKEHYIRHWLREKA